MNVFRDARISIKDILDDPDTFITEEEKSLFELVAIYEYSLAEASKHMGLGYYNARKSFKACAGRIIRKLKDSGVFGPDDLIYIRHKSRQISFDN